MPVEARRLPLGAALAVETGIQQQTTTTTSGLEPLELLFDRRTEEGEVRQGGDGVPVEGPEGVVEVEDDEARERLEQPQDLQRLRLHALVAHLSPLLSSLRRRRRRREEVGLVAARAGWIDWVRRRVRLTGREERKAA